MICYISVLKPVAVPLLRAEAYRRIRQAILRGELAPGARLQPHELARQLQLSRMPVREALARLSDEGLVEVRPRSGTRVSPIRVDDASQALVVVTAMHELAVRAAIPRLQAAHLERLDEIVDHLTSAVQRGDYDAAIAADDDFHGLFAEVAGNRPVRETLERYLPLLRRLAALHYATPPGHHSIAEHAEIMRASRDGDVEAAVSTTRSHWMSLMQEIEHLRSCNEEADTDEVG